MHTSKCLSVGVTRPISTHFTVANGVKQGGVISPILFNLYMYMDKLSVALNSSGIGGYSGNVFS